VSITPPPGYGQWAATWSVAGGLHEMVCTMGFHNLGPFSAATALGQMNNAMFGATHLFDFAILDDEYTMVQTYVLINNGGVLSSFTSITNNPGLVSGGALPPNVSVVIHKLTALAGRQYRGRMAMPAGYIDQLTVDDAGNIDPLTLPVYQNRANNSFGQSVLNNVPFYLLHGPDNLGVTPAPTQVSSLQASGLVGSQRKRLR